MKRILENNKVLKCIALSIIILVVGVFISLFLGIEKTAYESWQIGVGFLGTVLGGSAALVAMLLTTNEMRKDRKVQILMIEANECSELITNYYDFYTKVLVYREQIVNNEICYEKRLEIAREERREIVNIATEIIKQHMKLKYSICTRNAQANEKIIEILILNLDNRSEMRDYFDHFERARADVEDALLEISLKIKELKD
ncbi:MAG: hypothetical protein ACRCWG_10305 [Sarcina sp.]